MLENWRRSARNFLDLDDVPVTDEGELVDAQSIISLPQAKNRCVLPHFERTPDDAFLRKIDASGKKWVIVTNPTGEPVFVLDTINSCVTRCLMSSKPIPTTIGIGPSLCAT